jgi:hypothetical protein
MRLRGQIRKSFRKAQSTTCRRQRSIRVASQALALTSPVERDDDLRFFALPRAILMKPVEPMSLRNLIRAYLCSATYAALIIVQLHGPRLLVTGLLQLAICVSLLVLLLILLSYRNEIRDLVVCLTQMIVYPF